MTSSDPFGLIGQVLDGQFRVDKHIGEGGFSVVYRGTHVGLSEPIAIKCLKLPAALGSALVESFVKRFRDESRLQYRLSQGNLHIVRSLGSGTTIAPATSALVPYTVFEWLEGKSLAQEFNDRRDAGLHGRSLREVVALLDSALDALAYAHAQGVVHRDLNPGNLFLTRTSSGTKLKVLDFGVAKVLADSALAIGPTARTVGNVRMFAPAYGAPEQFDDRSGAIGPWTDVYAIALVVLEALTDRTVMEGEHLGEYALKALDAARRPSPRSLGVAVGDATEKVFLEALALDPTRRPRDAGEFWGMLKNALQVDAKSGRPAHAAPSQDGSITTLRMKESARKDGEPSFRPGAQGPLGGTLRMDRNPRSASELLAATPVPPAVTPLPPSHPFATPIPSDASIPRMTPLPRITPLPGAAGMTPRLSDPGRSGPSAAPSYVSPSYAAPAMSSPRATPTPPSPVTPVAPPQSATTALLILAVVAIVLAGAVGVGWHVWHAPAPSTSAHP